MMLRIIDKGRFHADRLSFESLICASLQHGLSYRGVPILLYRDDKVKWYLMLDDTPL